MPTFLIPVLSWLFREVMVKFLVLSLVYIVISVMLPLMLEYVAPFIGISSLSSAFSSLPAGVWYFLDFARLDIGLPSILSTAVTLFILRRIPFLIVK